MSRLKVDIPLTYRQASFLHAELGRILDVESSPSQRRDARQIRERIERGIYDSGQKNLEANKRRGYKDGIKR